MKINLGDKVRDKVTGFEGVVTSLAQHLTGCDRAWLEPGIDKDGKRMEGGWYDLNTLDVVSAGHVIVEPIEEAAPLRKVGASRVSAPPSLPSPR